MIFIFAQRAQSRGLLSSKNGFKDVCLSILGGATKAAYDSGNHELYAEFLSSAYDDAMMIRRFSKTRKKGEKPVLRVRG